MAKVKEFLEYMIYALTGIAICITSVVIISMYIKLAPESLFQIWIVAFILSITAIYWAYRCLFHALSNKNK